MRSAFRLFASSTAAFLLCAVLGGGAGACERSPQQQTALFREAESHFERGEYEDALDAYQAFLDRYPQHRLAETARLRIRSLNREVQSVMGRDDMQTPRHVAEESDDPDGAPPSSSESEGDSVPTADAGDGA